jgi:3-hydroxyisobutyrate/3-hydroxypropionate dehydrogenase
MGGLSNTREQHWPLTHTTGYPMAKNLRSKIPLSDVLVVNDVNSEATRRFVDEFRIANPIAGTLDEGVGIEVAKSPREVAERSVCSVLFSI